MIYKINNKLLFIVKGNGYYLNNTNFLFQLLCTLRTIAAFTNRFILYIFSLVILMEVIYLFC